MAIQAKWGAGTWDMLICEDCTHMWNGLDVDFEWTDDPEPGGHGIHCPSCDSTKVMREERG